MHPDRQRHAPWQTATCTLELKQVSGALQCINILSLKYSWINSKFPLDLHFFLNRIVAGHEIYCRSSSRGHFITLRCALRHAAAVGLQRQGRGLRYIFAISELLEKIACVDSCDCDAFLVWWIIHHWQRVEFLLFLQRLKESPMPSYEAGWWACGDICLFTWYLSTPLVNSKWPHSGYISTV